MTNLQLTHLRIDCTAVSRIKLGGHYAGNNLRNALANVMRRATCPQNFQKGQPPPEHVATCPACWLLTANSDPGSVVRAYAVIPPLPPRHIVAAGESFAFGLTLFGDGFQFLPYFVLALNEVGRREGLGPGRREGGGRFEVGGITAVDPLRGDVQTLLSPGDNLVHMPTCRVDATAVASLAERETISRQHQAHLAPHQPLSLCFHTPLRLEEKGQTYKMPDFGVLFRRLLYRIDDLGRHFAGQERRERDEVAALHAAADGVRLVEADTTWHELWVRSGRTGRKVPLGGLTGTAVYTAADWKPLLPWLVWGQATQVGKSAVKGNGVYELTGAPWPTYWSWLYE